MQRVLSNQQKQPTVVTFRLFLRQQAYPLNSENSTVKFARRFAFKKDFPSGEYEKSVYQKFVRDHTSVQFMMDDVLDFESAWKAWEKKRK